MRIKQSVCYPMIKPRTMPLEDFVPHVARIGYAAIEKIEGSFYNVMGLPVQKLYSELSVFLEKEDRILQS